MTPIEPLLAALNDDQALNDQSVIDTLIDVVRDSGPHAVTNDIIQNLRKYKNKSQGPDSEIAQKMLLALEDVNIQEYQAYLSKLDGSGIKFLHLLSEGYPNGLWEIESQPIALYKRGTANLNKPNVAVVGTRDATDGRLNDTFEISSKLANNGYTVVSGLAQGVDTQAHTGALDGGGLTIAVLPGDIESIYPKSNSSLAEEIVNRGALLSEISEFRSMHNGRYIERNRITSGISDAIVVTAAGESGGTIRQASIAAKQGKPRYFYDPHDGTNQSPNILREKGFVPFSDENELINLLSDRDEIFSNSPTKRRTLSEF
jgi:DNA processing protein